MYLQLVAQQWAQERAKLLGGLSEAECKVVLASAAVEQCAGDELADRYRGVRHAVVHDPRDLEDLARRQAGIDEATHRSYRLQVALREGPLAARGVRAPQRKQQLAEEARVEPRCARQLGERVRRVAGEGELGQERGEPPLLNRLEQLLLSEPASARRVSSALRAASILLGLQAGIQRGIVEPVPAQGRQDATASLCLRISGSGARAAARAGSRWPFAGSRGRWGAGGRRCRRRSAGGWVGWGRARRRSKSITASGTPLVRIQRLTARRLVLASGLP